MILLIDNYDSFSYNLYQLLGREYAKVLPGGIDEAEKEILVKRNDEITLDEIKELSPKAIFLSPGPGRPVDAGICEDVVKTFGGVIPIFGVCLGHQAICEALGGKVDYAKELMHGKKKKIKRNGKSLILKDLPETFEAARYHSLVAVADSLPSSLKVTAVAADDGEVMSVEDPERKIFGLQFHPESVMTDEGYRIIDAFLALL